MKSLAKIIIAVVICEGIGLAGGLFTFPSIVSWYGSLVKPFLTPPNFIFGPVWTALYLLIGISLGLVWTEKSVKLKSRKKQAIKIFSVQLILNFLWSVIFFYLHQKFLAVIEIFILWLTIMLCIYLFRNISKLASFLLVPYFLWVSFAGYLTVMIWILNP